MQKLIFILLLVASFVFPANASQLPEMEVTGLVVVESGKNATIINDKIYYQGSYIEINNGLAKVENITMYGVLITFNGNSSLLKMKGR